MIVRVYHDYYGCETGCCGHVVEVDGKREGRFSFDHPYGVDPRAFAERLIREELGDDHVKDLDWANSEVSDD